MFCFLTSGYFGLNTFVEKDELRIDEDLPAIDLPHTAAAPEFYNCPQVSSKYISPETTPGEGDYTLLTFSPDQAVNYTVNISAWYDPFPSNSVFFLAKYGVYRMSNGTWLVAAQPGNLSIGEKRNIYLGIGQTPSSIFWQPLGLANNTDGIAVAGNGSHISVVYLEKAIEDAGPVNSWPVRWVKYFASADYGATWENGVLWDCSLWNNTKFSQISMDVNSTGFFECMWGFSNSSADAFNCGTIWEARKSGSGSWSSAKNLTSFTGPTLWAVAPKVMYNHSSNVLYVCVNKVATRQSVIYELGNGTEEPWTSAWYLQSFIVESLNPQIFCALDDVNGHYYFVNASTGSIDGIRNATNWKGTLRDNDWIDTRQLKNTFFLFADNGPRMFTSGASTPMGEIRPGILDAESPFFFYHYNGSLDTVEQVGISFNGKDLSGDTHGARAFRFTINIESETGSKSYGVNIGVDETFPSLNITTNTNYISPITSLGSNDALQFDSLSNKSGTMTLRVESLASPVQVKSNITDEVFNYYNPALGGDGLNYFLFYNQKEGESLYKLMMTKSTDGGLSWGDAVELDTSSQSYSNIHPVLDGNLLYCWYQIGGIGGTSYLLASFNGGETFVKLILEAGYHKISEDKSVWIWQSSVGADAYNLSRSLDLGFTWEPFLSIPATDIGFYITLESVAFDPQSKNYSFIFSNKSMDVMALISNYEGTNITIREDIASGGNPSGGKFGGGDLQVDAWHNSSGEFGWIVTCSDYYPVDIIAMSSTLAFCQINSNGDVSSWNNFTAISGDPLRCFNTYWDLIIASNSTPCFVRLIVDPLVGGLNQIEVSTATSFVFSKSMDMVANEHGNIVFNGISSIGEILPEGEYKWMLNYIDLAGHKTFENGSVIIHHTAPILGNFANLTTPGYAVPRLPCVITVPAVDSYLSHASLRYRTSDAQPWTEVTMTPIFISPTERNFTGTIPILESDSVYWRVEIFDLAGNSLVVDSNGQPYTYREPHIRIDENPEPIAQFDLTLTQAFNVSFIVPEFSEYVSYLYIDYSFDDGTGMHTEHLVATSPSTFYYTFAQIPANATELEYTVYAVDLYGGIIPLGRVRTISLIPALPSWELSPGQQLFAIIASLIVGILTGLVYASLTRRKLKPIPRREISELEKVPARKESQVEFRGYKVAFIITALFIAGSLVGAYYFFFIVQWSEAAMLCFLGTFLATTLMWILFMDHSTIKVLRESRPRIRVTLPLIIGFSIFIALVAMFMVGNNVAWWRVRINENPYVVFGIILPQLMTTLVATFFSSIIFLTRSIAKDVERISKELADAELHNENPGRIFNRREGACLDILKSIGQKGVIFVAIIGITIVFASDLSAYAVQGVLIILPFAGGALLTLFIINRQVKVKEKKSDTILYDKLTVCAKCGKQTALGGSFCEHCGEHLVQGTRVVTAMVCPACRQLTPKGGEHCGYCNALLKPLEQKMN